MADTPAFMPPSQSEYAFPADQGQADDADAAEQRAQQIQAAFDQQRFQRAFVASLAKQIGQLQARQKGGGNG